MASPTVGPQTDEGALLALNSRDDLPVTGSRSRAADQIPDARLLGAESVGGVKPRRRSS